MTGKEIKDARTKKGMSQQELASIIGVSLQSIHNWESGKSNHHKFLEEKIRKELK